MHIAQFIWEPGDYDDAFHRLNQRIDQVARSLPGFLGAEVWYNADRSRGNATYYWDSLDTLKAFSVDPTHQEAKRHYARWYKGYHIIISQVVRSYGDGAFEHITPNTRQATA